MMSFSLRRTANTTIRYVAISLVISSVSLTTLGQSPSSTGVTLSRVHPPAFNEAPTTTPAVAPYYDPLQGSSSEDVVRRALLSNAELAAARLDINRARTRVRQAGLRPNPILEFEQTTGRLTGSAGERETTVGVALPVELGGKRHRRIELAQAELEAAEAEVADRERRLTSEVYG
ncbi:MAG TPA: TolC family protein, partial [Pyrinomonadaceae bacterium]|nr:TolC family protein [Pyrinomonadaceae bacterium]